MAEVRALTETAVTVTGYALKLSLEEAEALIVLLGDIDTGALYGAYKALRDAGLSYLSASEKFKLSGVDFNSQSISIERRPDVD